MERPTLIYKLQLNDGSVREIKWTYGLQLDCQRILPDPSAAMNNILADPETRDYLIRRVLTDNKKSIDKFEELVKIEDVPVDDPDMLADLLDWVAGHILYFFGRTASSLARHAAETKETLRPFSPSLAGSADSASSTPSTGPST